MTVTNTIAASDCQTLSGQIPDPSEQGKLDVKFSPEGNKEETTERCSQKAVDCHSMCRESI